MLKNKTISLMQPKERKEVISFIENHMIKSYGIKPPKSMLPSDMLIARRDGIIIGTLGLIFGSDKLYFEELYSFEKTDLPIDYVSEKCVYYTRWTSVENLIGLELALAGHHHAQKKGFEFASCIVKSHILTYLNSKMENLWYPISKAQLRKEKIPLDDSDYFTKGETPIPCLGQIQDQICALEKIVGEKPPT